MLSRIVAAYNDSPRAQRALAVAVQLTSQGNNTELFAVAVQRSLTLSGITIAEVRNAHAAGEQACAGWLSVALAYADSQNIELRTEIRIGTLGQQLANATVAHRADLLVLGGSRRGLRGLRLRSTVDYLSRRCRCAVMIVP